MRISGTDVHWGSSRDANKYRSAITILLELTNAREHVKHWRPQLLVLSGPPHTRPALVDLAGGFTKEVGLMICAYVCTSPTQVFC